MVFTFIDPRKPFRQIDIFLTNPLSFEEAYERRKVMNIGGIEVAVISVEDLIVMKTATGRPRDLEDISHLKKVMALKESE